MPKNSPTARQYYENGRQHSQRGQYQEAILAFDESLKLAWKSENALALIYENRGEAKRQLKLYQETIDDCTAALKHNTRSVYAFMVRGAAKRQLGCYEKAERQLQLYNEALDDFNTAIKLDPRSAFAYQELGATKRNLGYFKEAIHDLRCLSRKMSPQFLSN